MRKFTYFLVLIVVAIAVFMIVQSLRSPDSPWELTTLQITLPDFRPLSAQIEDWSKYKENKTITVGGTGECGNNPTFQALHNQANRGSRKVLRLNGVLDLVITPNYTNLTTDQFNQYNADDTAICAAGEVYPFRAYADKLLWKGVCSTGMRPDEGAPAGAEFNKCLEAEKAVEDYFKDRQ